MSDPGCRYVDGVFTCNVCGASWGAVRYPTGPCEHAAPSVEFVAPQRLQPNDQVMLRAPDQGIRPGPLSGVPDVLNGQSGRVAGLFDYGFVTVVFDSVQPEPLPAVLVPECWLVPLPAEDERFARSAPAIAAGTNLNIEDSMPNPIMKFFAYDHLPAALQAVSGPVGQLASRLDVELPDSAEKSAGMRKLLEAKDCFVRAALP